MTLKLDHRFTTRIYFRYRMSYEKGELTCGFKVSLLLKSAAGVETYRVRDPEGKLMVMKCGVSDAELLLGRRMDTFVGSVSDRMIYRHISGETLEKRLLRGGRLEEREAERLVRDLLSELKGLHEDGIAYRNLAPDNVMLEMVPGLDGWKGRLVGFGHLTHASRETVATDMEDMGRLIEKMLHGNDEGKVLAGPQGQAPGKPAGKLTLMESVMIKATEGGFGTADEMLAALDAGEPLKVDRRKSGPGFSAVAGMHGLKEKLRSEVIEILADPEEAERYGIGIPNGMLLYGPPGCGKTFIAERFAEETGYNYRLVKSSDLASVYIHGTQEKIAALFDEARADAPTIICFDEFDALVPRRDASSHNIGQSGEVNEFLSQLNNCGRDRVFVIGTTNRPDRIDPAVLRTGRIDYILYVPLPDYDARREIFELNLASRPHGDIDFDRLARKTEGYLASDIAAVVDTAARAAFRDKRKIGMDLLEKALKERRPGLPSSELKAYERMRESFENERSKGMRSVGFL